MHNNNAREDEEGETSPSLQFQSLLQNGFGNKSSAKFLGKVNEAQFN